MSGTWATYQGHACAAVVFRRGRGWAANVSEVVIPVAAFPAGFDWKAAKAELERRPALDLPNVEEGLGDSPRQGAALATGLAYEGTLVLAESKDRVFAVPGLVVTRVEAEQVGTGGPVFVRLQLADERLFAGFGTLRRWRWNVLLPDGSRSKDTLRPNGAAYVLAEVAEEVVGGLWRQPELSRTPPDWDTEAREVASPYPFPAASETLERLCTLGEAESPCLHLDGQVGIYRAGEGMLGWAADGKGPNANAIPPEVITDEDGASPGHSIEDQWPAEWMVVTGLERVATVALDNWEPVLMIDGRPYLLSEELVRYLTGGKLTTELDPGKPGVARTKVEGGTYGLAWLRKWIMNPNAQLGAGDVTEDVLELLSEQAWMLWRAPRVEKHADGFYTGELGANAHLVPLLDRAEVVRDSRRPPTVFAASWELKHRQWGGRVEFSQLTAANLKAAEVLRAVDTFLIARGLGETNPLRNGAPTVTGGGTEGNQVARSLVQIKGLTVTDMVGGGLLPAGADHELMNQALREYRKIQALREKGMEELASEYERALEERIRAEDALGDGTRALHYQAAKQLAEFERQAAETAFSNDDRNGVDGIRTIFRRQFAAQVAQILAALGRAATEARRRAESDAEAGRPRGQLREITFIQNNRRRPDAGATVVSRELGVIQTSARAGHAETEDVPDPSLTRFLPKPPRVLFGATLRPRIDVPVGTKPRVETGGEAAPDDAASLLGQIASEITGDVGFGDFVPIVLSDEESFFAAAFRRTAPGAVEPVELEKLPWDRAISIPRPWRELVPISGPGNRAALEEEARVLATQLSRKRDRVTSASYAIAGAWPVQCDGIVSAVEIRMDQVNGAPCGFTTFVSVGGEATVRPFTGTRERGS